MSCITCGGEAGGMLGNDCECGSTCWTCYDKLGSCRVCHKKVINTLSSEVNILISKFLQTQDPTQQLNKSALIKFICDYEH